MTRSTLLSLAAGAVITLGLSATMLPAFMANSQAIDYLRATANGRRSTTTGSERPARVPEHQYHNQESDRQWWGGQMVPEYPDNAGSATRRVAP